MKLSKLRGAIRSAAGNPSIIVELTPGHPMTLLLQKTPLLAELGRAYDGTDETGLTFDPATGILSGPGGVMVPIGDHDNDERTLLDVMEDDDIL